jgi:hypothetical protein
VWERELLIIGRKHYKITADGVYGPQTKKTISWYATLENGGNSDCVKYSDIGKINPL